MASSELYHHGMRLEYTRQNWVINTLTLTHDMTETSDGALVTPHRGMELPRHQPHPQLQPVVVGPGVVVLVLYSRVTVIYSAF